MSRRTVEAFVLSNTIKSNCYFAYSNQIARDIIINYKYVPHGVDLLGKWIRVVVHGDNCACQTVIIINDIYESRITDRAPEIKVEAIHDGQFEKKFEVFRHNYFGFIFDTSHVVQNINIDTPYQFWITRLHEPGINSRWRVANKQNCSNSWKTVEAIVHSYSLDEKGYYAWIRTDPRTKICVDYSMCPPSQDIIGRWITVTIDDNNCPKNPVEVIDDVFETRVRYGSTEIKVDFETGDAPGMYYNQYFGNISDPRQMVSQLESNVWYRGWIIFYIKRGVDTRWRLSKDQEIEGPFKIRRSESIKERFDENSQRHYVDYDAYDTKNREVNYSVIENEDDVERPKDYRHFTCLPKDDSAQQQNDPRNQQLFHKQSSSSNSSIKPQELGFHPPSYHEGQHRKVDNGDSHVENVDNLQNKINLKRQNNEIPATSIQIENLSTTPVPSSVGHENKCDVQNVINLSITTSARLDEKSDSEYYTCSDEEVEIKEHVKKASDFCSPMSIEPENAWKPVKTDEEKEIRRLKLEILQMSRLVQSLTQDSFVSDQMKQLNIEEYEELMELTKQ